MSELETRTYELCYNSACISLSKGNYEEAKEKLLRAEQLCKESFEDDPEEQEALENEIAIIKYYIIGEKNLHSRFYTHLFILS